MALAGLPARLSSVGEQVEDWNDIILPGFYWAPASALNSPGSSLPWSGVVLRLGEGGTVIQTLYQGALDAPADASKPGMRRYQISGAWTPWVAISGSGGGSTSVHWADILEKPATFAPRTQTVTAATGGNDLNQIYATGFYYVQIADAVNRPTDVVNTLNYLMIIQITAAGDGEAIGAQQLVWEMDQNNNTVVRSWTRAGGPWFLPPVWGAWRRTDPTATTSVQGFVELATTTEATTGTDTVRAVTPAGLKAVADTKAPLSHTHGLADITVTALGTTADLNTLTTAGLYHQNQNAAAGTGSNYPAAVAGLLEVYAASSMVYQRYTAYDGRGHWERSRYNTTWYGWRFISDSIADTTGTLPISRGGTGATTAAAARTAIDAAASTHGHALTDANITGILPPSQLPAATDTAIGGVERATQTEVNTGTDLTRYVTPFTLKSTLALPDPMWSRGDSANTLTAGASSWQALTSCQIVFTPARDLWVDIAAGAVCKASSGYTMIGFQIIGGISMAPDIDPAGGSGGAHWTPFTSSTVDTGMTTPTKRVLLPGGTQTTVTLYTRRSVSTGTHTTNYPILTLHPVRWA